MMIDKPIDVYASEQTWNYGYTGGYQVFTAPHSGDYQLDVWGAQGGNPNIYSFSIGGKGGYSEGDVHLQEGSSLYIYVGGQGIATKSTVNENGGWNGGGDNSSGGGGATGGGASDIRLNLNSNPLDNTSLQSRLIVAGGGSGGGWGNLNGAPGGGLNGINGQSWSGYANGLGGGQNSGGGTSGESSGIGQLQPITAGSLGKGGRGSGSSGGGSGGGGGYYGGGGGLVSTGGGGSGYIGGVKNGLTTAGNNSIPAPIGGIEVGHEGNGYAKITALNAPAVATISSPAQNTIYDNQESFVLNGRIHDPDSKGGSMKIEYRIDNGERKSGITVPSSKIATAFSIPITLPNLSLGNHNLRVFSIDNEGVEEEKTIAFRIIDNIAPTLNISGNPTSSVVGSATLQVTASDNSGSTRIKLPDGNWITGSSASYVVSKNGSYTFIAEDGSGNQTTKTVFVDKIRRVYSPVDFGYTGGYQTWTVPSTGRYKLETWGAQGGNGGTILNNYTQVNVQGVKGKNGTHSTGEILLTSGEVLFLYVGAVGGQGGETALGSGASPGGGGGGGGTSVKKGGNLIISAVGGDGGQGATSVATGSPPGIAGIGGWGDSQFKGSNGLGGNGGGAGGLGGKGGGYNFTANLGFATSLPNIRIGNGSARITPTNSAPSVIVTSPSANKQFEAGSSFTLEGTIKDADASGTMTVKYSIDGGAEVSVSTMTNLDIAESFQKVISLPNGMTVGNHTLRVWGEDNDSLQSDIISVPFSIRDNIAPSIAVTGNSTDWTNGDVILNVQGTDNESGVKRIQLPNGTWVNGSSYNFIAKENGSYSFVVEDGGGNQASQTVVVTKIDKLKPNAPIVDTQENWTSSDVVVSMNANGDTGGSGVERVEYTLQGATSKIWTTYTEPLNITAEGRTTILTRVMDIAGNISSENTKVVQIDKTLPQLEGTLSTDSWTNQSLTIELTGYDALSGIKHIELPNGNKIKANQSSFVVSANGNYTFHAEDNAGNKITKTISVTNIDKKSPTASHVIKHIDGDSYQVTITAVDDASGMKSIKLPSGDFVYGSQATLNVTKGESYTFELEDKAGNKSPYSIKVDVPELNVYQKDNHVKAEWAVEMLEQDNLWSSSFEDGQSRPNFGGNPGGQSITSENAYTGTKSMKAIDTIINGNHYNYPQTKPDKSITYYEKQYPPNGSDISLSFRFKGNGTISYSGDGGWAEEFVDKNNLVVSEDVPINSKTIKLDDVKGISLYGHVTFSQDFKNIGTYYAVSNIDISTNTITLNSVIKQALKKGDTIHVPKWVGAFNFGSRATNSDDWTLVNINTKVNNYPKYDVAVKGGSFISLAYTHTGLYIDDLKIGYATKSQLYRGEKLLYEGFLSDYEDKEATDKAKPNKLSAMNIQAKQGKLIMDIQRPEDNGTEYEYTVKAVSNKGDSVSSEKKKVNVTSDIDGYSYVVDTNPTTVPDNTVDTKNEKIEYAISTNEKYYVHVKSIDNAGNVSEVSHFSFQDNIVPTMTLTQNPTGWTSSSVQITAKAIDIGLGMKRIKRPDGTWVDGDTATYTVTQNGTYTFVAEDMVGNQTTKSITISNIDTTAPTVPTITNNQNWTKIMPVVVSITAGTDSQSGVNRVEYKLEGATIKGWTTYANPLQINNEGETKVIARTIDNLGQTSIETYSYVRIDISTPHNTGITIKLKP